MKRLSDYDGELPRRPDVLRAVKYMYPINPIDWLTFSYQIPSVGIINAAVIWFFLIPYVGLILTGNGGQVSWTFEILTVLMLDYIGYISDRSTSRLYAARRILCDEDQRRKRRKEEFPDGY